MPRKLSERQKEEMINNFINGFSLVELSEKFNCTKITVTRHLKKGITEETFKNVIKKNNKNEIELDNNKNYEFQKTLSNKKCEEKKDRSSLEIDSFIEIAPLSFEIDEKPQKDLSSIPISEIELPKIVYMIVDNKIELKTKPLGDYPDWQFLSQNELSRSTIEIFFDMKIAKRYCNKEQKVLKVPNTNIFKIVAPILVSRGISRLVCPDKLIAL